MTTLTDLLRLVIVPALGWAAYRDVRTRRVPNVLWGPLAAFGVLLLFWEGVTSAGDPFFSIWLIRVILSVGVVIPLAYGFWLVGGFGGADAKAFMVLAVLFPTFPIYRIGSTVLPIVTTDVGVFSLTVLTNTVLIALVYPLGLAARNLLDGNLAWVVFLGRPVPVERVTELPGSLLETSEGYTRNGLDLDALRMYLRWRGVTLDELRADPSLRHPATLPDDPNDPTDGAVATDGGGDPWGAEAFLADIDTDAYGTSPETLRDGLDRLIAANEVWITPGIPFVVPTFVGLVVALTAGDLLFAALTAIGLV